MAILQSKVTVYEKNLKTEQQRRKLLEMFQKIGSKFYYLEEKIELNWFAAANKCTELGAHLVSFQNKQELDAIATILNLGKKYWIDVNDLSIEGEFRSRTTGLLAPFLFWYPVNNPNNMDDNEHCVHLWTWTDSITGMNDEKCKKTMSFICELFEE